MTTAKKATLTSILFTQIQGDEEQFISDQATSVADYLIKKSDSVQMDTVLAILKEAVKKYPSLLKEKAEQEAKDEEIRQQQQAEANAAAKAEEERIKGEKEAMLQKLLTAGIDEDTAAFAVAASFKKKLATTGGVYQRVNVTVDGKQYDMPVRGNMSKELKELLATKGFKDNREGFIKEYRS
jgi:translation initiation factor 1 (eIF-1/SUI1)